MADDTPGQGHNSAGAADDLKAYVERIERVETEQKELADDKKEIYAEAKSKGFDVAVLRKVVARRKREREEIREEEALIETYEAQLGIFG